MNNPEPPRETEDEPILTAADVVNYKIERGAIPRIAPPRNVLLCFQPSLLASLSRTHKTRKIGGFFGELVLLPGTRGQTAIAGNFGVGAPAAVALLEELVAFGVRRFIAVGLAGGLQAGLSAGSLVVCERALRDEGTSRHYLPAEKFVTADPALSAALCRALQSQGQPFAAGASWTTDAPYRETRGAVEQYRQEGILTVEMEAAALFAAGRRLGAAAGAAFAVADSLQGLRWQIAFDRERAERGLRTLADAALRIFAEAP